jgi:shikimate dehydrogenase
MWPSATTRPILLIGDPVAHSLSPAVHNAAFRELGLDLVYLACRVPAARLADAMGSLLALGAAGANVTLPHKPAAATLVSHLTGEASATGVVNTLVRAGDGWIGANTDVQGFLAPLRAAGEMEHRDIVVLGAGGAARAVVYALLTTAAPGRLTVAARNAGRAAELVSNLSPFDSRGALGATDLPSASPILREATLIVNATPLGMWPAAGSSPWPDAADFGPRHLVYDLIYTPTPTRLLIDAAARGSRTMDGRAMLLHQAAASFELWTGREMPLAVAGEALDRAMAEQSTRLS